MDFNNHEHDTYFVVREFEFTENRLKSFNYYKCSILYPMKICIIGAGPSGMYLAKFLSQNNHFVTIFEKQNTIGGYYKYAQLPKTKLDSLENILQSKNIILHSNTEINKHNFKEIEKEHDAFVLATGGIPLPQSFGNKNISQAVDTIKRIIMGDNSLKIGPKILIIGMGNVSLDLVKLLFGGYTLGLSESIIKKLKDIKNVDVVSRSSLLSSKFTNPVMREVLDLKNVSINVEKNDRQKPIFLEKIVYFINRRISSLFGPIPSLKEENERFKKSRLLMFDKINPKKEDRHLELLFNTQIKEINQDGSSFVVKFCNGITKTYDTVISSLGFRSQSIELNTKKPVFKIGWCDIPRGNINDALNQAKILSMDIEKSMKRYFTK